MIARVLAGIAGFVIVPAVIGLIVDGWHGALIGAIAFPAVGAMCIGFFGFTWLLGFVLMGERLRL